MIDLEKIQNAITLTKNGKIQEAEAIYQDQLTNSPNDFNLLSIYGLFCVNIGNFEKACGYLEKASQLHPSMGTLSALGFAEIECNKLKEAVNHLEKALEYGQNIDIFNKLILNLFKIKSYQKAISYADKMYELYPTDTRAIANKVKALTQSGKLYEAEELCVNSLKQTPDSPSLWFHLGYLTELIYCDDKQAKECYKAAKELGVLEADYNIAVSSQKLGELEEAEIHYKKMLQKLPNDINTQTSLGMCYLMQKKFQEGYSLYFKRDKSMYSNFAKNLWQPNFALDKEINIICDQGFGDHIMFSRYLPFFKDKKINVGTRESLKELFKSNFPNINFVRYEELNPEIQTIFIADLPYILNMDFSQIPYSSGYIQSKTAEILCEKPKIGFCWEAGSAAIRTMINRTINIKFFEKMLNLDNIQIYSFQKDDTLKGNDRYPQMINLAKNFNTFSDTAAALMAMDVMVTVDTSVAHLAGALGIKTYLLLPYAADWRWFNDTRTTPWYDSIKIFKQQNSISWEQEINEIVAKLKKLA